MHANCLALITAMNLCQADVTQKVGNAIRRPTHFTFSHEPDFFFFLVLIFDLGFFHCLARFHVDLVP